MTYADRMKCTEQVRSQGRYHRCGYFALSGDVKCAIHQVKRPQKPRVWTRKLIRQQRERIFGSGGGVARYDASITPSNYLQFMHHDVPGKRVRVVNVNPDTLQEYRRNWPDYML